MTKVQKRTPPLRELDLGEHILLVMIDGSIELFPHPGQASDLPVSGLHLESDETYRLMISLYEEFKQDSFHAERPVEE